MQARGVRQLLQPLIDDLKPEGVLLVIAAGVGQIGIELFVFGCAAGGAPRGRQRLLRLRISDVGLGQQVVDGSAAQAESSSACRTTIACL